MKTIHKQDMNMVGFGIFFILLTSPHYSCSSVPSNSSIEQEDWYSDHSMMQCDKEKVESMGVKMQV